MWQEFAKRLPWLNIRVDSSDKSQGWRKTVLVAGNQYLKKICSHWLLTNDVQELVKKPITLRQLAKLRAREIEMDGQLERCKQYLGKPGLHPAMIATVAVVTTGLALATIVFRPTTSISALTRFFSARAK